MTALLTRWRFDAIGVPWSIETPDHLDAGTREAVTAEIDRFDRTWSRFRADSLVSRMATTPGAYRLPAEAGRLLDTYRVLHAATGGRMSPLVGRALEHYGYDAAYRLSPAPGSPRVPRWEDALAWDGDTLTLLRPALLDVGAAGKGLLADRVSAVLTAAGASAHVVDASGDIRRQGLGVERVALEHPADPTRAIGVVELGDGALCASAANRRAWAGVHHVVDAVTGEPTRGVIATWVLAPSALVADGLATALFFADADACAGAGAFEWVRMWADGRIEHSPALPGEVFA